MTYPISFGSLRSWVAVWSIQSLHRKQTVSTKWIKIHSLRLTCTERRRRPNNLIRKRLKIRFLFDLNFYLNAAHKTIPKTLKRSDEEQKWRRKETRKSDTDIFSSFTFPSNTSQQCSSATYSCSLWSSISLFSGWSDSSLSKHKEKCSKNE